MLIHVKESTKHLPNIFATVYVNLYVDLRNNWRVFFCGFLCVISSVTRSFRDNCQPSALLCSSVQQVTARVFHKSTHRSCVQCLLSVFRSTLTVYHREW